MFLEIISSPILIWFLVGLVLILMEFVIPGLVIVFFGIGAWVVTILVSIFPSMAVWVQLMIFTIFSVTALVLLRRSLKKRFFDENQGAESEKIDDFIGHTALVEKAIAKNRDGKVTFKGVSWGAIAEEDIPEGASVKIIGKESIRLKVEALEK